MRRAADGDIQPDGQHQVFENLPVFALFDGVGLRADHLHVEPLEHAGIVQFHGRVQRCLTAQCGQQNQFADGAQTLHFGLFAHDDFLHRLRGNWLDIGSVRELRIGHDGGRVGVDEDHTVTLFPQCFAGLGSRIIEFTGLSDDDRARANDEDGVDVGALRHGQKSWRMKHGPCPAGDGNL